ncbi:MAG: hypothetical protein RMX98_027770, partial [Nostoc sp. DedQUE02]
HQQSVEQQFGLRAFIGAGRLQSTKLAQASLSKTEIQESIAPEIAASGRLLDVERLVERVGRLDYKLIVVHGQSGVGKSSLVNAGLVPALKNKAIGIKDNLPVVMRVYTNWLEELGRLIQQALNNKSIGGDGSALELENSTTIAQTDTLTEQLLRNEQHNLRTVLIFDQFEEFFFVYTEPKQRRQFFEFMGECLNILSVKVILSLRVDYLHYLLECNRLPSMTIVGNDLLSKNILYELGNFSPDDTKSIIERLTQTTSFQLESALIEQLVNELAGELGEVRPIELQVVGAQLQTENITTLEEYQQRGTKEELVKRYLAEVVNDCGVENQQVAELLLYLLTDEKGTRPLKTRVELERDLQALVADITTELNRLDLVLAIFVKSGLIVLLPENPFDRYQLVHDYLAAFIRQQQQPKLQELMAELEKEKKQRLLAQEQLQQSEQAKQILAIANTKATQRIRLGSGVLGISLVLAGIAAFFANQAYRLSQEAQTGARLERIGITAWQNFQLQEIEPLLLAMQAGQELQGLVKDKRPLEQYPAASPQLALQTILNNVHEHNQLKGHTSYVNNASFSADGKHIVTASVDNTARVWDLSGKQIALLKGHTGIVINASFSADGKHIVTASEDKTAREWDLSGKQIALLKGHTGIVINASFSADGKHIVTASDDNTARVWDLSGKQIAELKGHTSYVYNASFSADGKHIVTASEDNTARVWRVDSLNELLSRGCQWLNDYLVINPKDLQTLTVCQNKSNLIAAAPFLVKQGEQEAKSGYIENAIATFQTAFKWNPNLKFDPKVKATEFANIGKAESLIQESERIVKESKVQQAVANYNDAQKLDPQIEISADSWNTLCWEGSLRRQAKLVMFACEKAVNLQPDNGSFRNSRGLAKALTGNSRGAIADFEAYIAQANDQDKAQRQRWVKDLKAGKNPFTDEELKKLLQ